MVREHNQIQMIPVWGHYIDAYFVTQKSIEECHIKAARAKAKNFVPIDLSADEHRALTALFGIIGHNEKAFREGITVSAYELCKRMGYAQDKKCRFGGKARESALAAVLHLAENSYTLYLRKYDRNAKGNNKFNVIVIPGWHILDIIYESSNVTREEFLAGDVKKKVVKLHVKMCNYFYNETYYRLLEADFYKKLNAILRQQKRKVTKYHWNFALWYIKQAHKRKTIEINVDKLIRGLRIPADSAHMARSRRKIRQIYEDFKAIGYLESFTIDVLGVNGNTKDVLISRGETG